MKRILLPTDFSENAENAVHYALQLYENETCEFHLLHTYTPTAYYSDSMFNNYPNLEMEEELKLHARRELRKFTRKLAQNYKNPRHTFKVHVSFNLLILEMSFMLQEQHFEMVIMGTKGATGAKEIFLGTNTMYAIKKLKCPVLAVPSDYKFKEPKQILFATDFRLKKDYKYLHLIKSLCQSHDSLLHILNAFDSSPLNDEQLDIKDYLNYYFENPHRFHLAEGTEVVSAVREFERKNNIHLLTMIHNKHNFFENLLFKSAISQLVYHIELPFLVLPSVVKPAKEKHQTKYKIL